MTEIKKTAGNDKIGSNPFEHLGLKPKNFKLAITELHIDKCDPLIPNPQINTPLIQIHVIDTNTGDYLKKSNPLRAVTRYNEQEHIDYILPVLSKVPPYNSAMRFAPKCDKNTCLE
jgi:hypothetical protein